MVKLKSTKWDLNHIKKVTERKITNNYFCFCKVCEEIGHSNKC